MACVQPKKITPLAIPIVVVEESGEEYTDSEDEEYEMELLELVIKRINMKIKYKTLLALFVPPMRLLCRISILFFLC